MCARIELISASHSERERSEHTKPFNFKSKIQFSILAKLSEAPLRPSRLSMDVSREKKNISKSNLCGIQQQRNTRFFTQSTKKNETKNRESFKRVDLAARLKQTSPNHDLLYFSLLARMAVLLLLGLILPGFEVKSTSTTLQDVVCLLPSHSLFSRLRVRELFDMNFRLSLALSMLCFFFDEF